MKYSPQNEVATYEDQYGETRIIHRPRGGGLREFKGEGTIALQLNRSVAVLLGENVRRERKRAGMTLKELGIKAHMASATPKQYIYGIEKAIRQDGVRLGTLLLLSKALDVSPCTLLPSFAEAANHADLKTEFREQIILQSEAH